MANNLSLSNNVLENRISNGLSGLEKIASSNIPIPLPDFVSNASIIQETGIKINSSYDINQKKADNNNLVVKLPITKVEGTDNTFAVPLAGILPLLDNDKIKTISDFNTLSRTPDLFNLNNPVGRSISNGRIEYNDKKEPQLLFESTPISYLKLDAVGEISLTGLPQTVSSNSLKAKVDFTFNPNGVFNPTLNSGSVEFNQTDGSTTSSASITAKQAVAKPSDINQMVLQIPSAYLKPEIKNEYLGVDSKNQENIVKNQQPQIKR